MTCRIPGHESIGQTCLGCMNGGEAGRLERKAYWDKRFAREKLESAAHDMALVLLSIEWQWRERCEFLRCPACDADQPRGHAAECALDACLRKAGVR